MWYRQAQQGIMNLDKRLFQGAEQAIINWIKSSAIDGDLPNAPQEYKGQYFLGNLEVPDFLKGFINNIDHNISEGANAEYHPGTKTISIPYNISKKELNNLLGNFIHEIRHSIDPRNQNQSYMSKILTQYQTPSFIQKKLALNFMKTQQLQSYDDFIISTLRETYQGNIMDLVSNNEMFQKVLENLKRQIPKSQFDIAFNTILKGEDIYLKNPIEHSSQLGDVRGLLDKTYLDEVKKKYYPNLNIKQWKDYLKNTLMNINSAEFETLSNQIQEASENNGNTISYIVKQIKNPTWQKQYAKQVSNALSEYVVPGNPLSNLVRRENRVIPSNPNANKNLSAFMEEAQRLEKLSESNPGAWNKFISSNFAIKMINGKIYNLFKGIGSGSKSLSQSIKGLNMNSPYWALLEPALEFGLYQFGLFLENPKAFNLETPEQKTLRDLNTRINEILANNKITDKRGYFIKNYGSYLKTLGSMEQNELLGKFPVMGFNNFMNIGRNIGQKS
jgi:hypothetical protein